MRAVVTALALGLTVGCITNLQHHAAFGAGSLAPAQITAAVGDVVSFQVTPRVAADTEWSLVTHGKARFAGQASRSYLDWLPRMGPIAFEAIVSAWDPTGGYEREASRGWLWFELQGSGASQSFDRDLPIARLPFREIGPVTVSTTFSLAPRGPERIWLGEGHEQIFIRYLTPVSQGFPHAPRVKAMLLETQGKKRLYAEIRTNYGDRPVEPVGYEVTLSYPVKITGPVEVILVEWRGHGWYHGPFEVYRTTAGAGAVPQAAPTPATKPPALSPVTTPPVSPAPPRVESVIPGSPGRAP